MEREVNFTVQCVPKCGYSPTGRTSDPDSNLQHKESYTSTFVDPHSKEEGNRLHTQFNFLRLLEQRLQI
jgi:hypothetical protein